MDSAARAPRRQGDRPAHDATVNDVLVSAVAGALGCHLARDGRAADAIHALVPFNLRPLDEPPPPELGNHFGLVPLEPIVLAWALVTGGLALQMARTTTSRRARRWPRRG